MRIVWYFDARDQTRAFTISYTLRGVAVAYDDVVDVNLKVWGDQWDEPLDRLVGDRDGAGEDPARLGQARVGSRRRRAGGDARDAPRRRFLLTSSSSCGR